MDYSLFISYDGMTDPLGQSQVIPYIRKLSQSGFKIILISYEKKSRHEDRTDIQKILSSYGIIWKPLTYHKRPVIPSTILDILLGTFITLFYCQKYKVRIIHCRSYIAALIAYLCKPFCKFRLIFDMRGFWADERIDGNIWDKNKLVHRAQYSFFKFMERKFLEMSDQVITLTEAAKKYIRSRFRLKREIVVIPCSTDLKLFNAHITPIGDPELRIAKNESKLVITYIGSVGTWYLLPEMFQFFKILSEIRPAVFLIVTPDSKQLIAHEAEKSGINLNDVIVRTSTRQDVPKWLKASDAGIFFIKPVFSKTASSPVKHGEMMACGLPVITNSGIGDLDEIIAKSGTGVVIKDWKPETMRDAAKKLLTLIREKNNFRFEKAAEEYYSLDTASLKYIEIYNNLLKADDL